MRKPIPPGPRLTAAEVVERLATVGRGDQLQACSQKHRRNMPVIEVLGHVPRNYSLVGLNEVEISDPHFGCDLEPDMQKLAQAAVVCRCSGNVAERTGVLLRRPIADLLR